MERYKAHAVCRVCGITPRTLEYWITTGVFQPTGQIKRAHRGGRPTFLFSFRDLVRIRVIKENRDAGISLGAIRHAIRQLSDRHGENWQKAWIVTDGRRLFEATNDPARVRSLVSGEAGQFVMAAVAVGQIERWVDSRIKRLAVDPVDLARFRGRIGRWVG